MKISESLLRASRSVRPGTTLVELILFTALVAICSGAVLTLLFSTSEGRLRQQTATSVEQSGVQLLQTLSRRIHAAERILYPAAGASGTVLSLQIADDFQNPTIIAVESGVLLVGEHEVVRPLSGSQVLVTNLRVSNTSISANKSSVFIRFTLTQTAPLPKAYVYSRTFESLISLFPDDEPQGNACGCAAGQCVSGRYRWQVCDQDVCSWAGSTVPCS